MSEATPTLDGAGTSETVKQLQLGVAGQKPRTLLGDAWRRFRKHRLAMGGAFVLLFFILAVIIGPTIYVRAKVAAAEAAGTPIPAIDQNFRAMVEQLDFDQVTCGAGGDPCGPSRSHWFGVDELGRDMFARALLGGRISLAVGFAAMIVAISLGTIIGATAGYFGGVVDQALMRITDLFLSLPVLPLLLLSVYLFREPVQRALGQESGIFVIVVIMVGALAWMSTARIVRASFLSLKQKEFVEAANALGISRGSIMFRHIMPNAMSPIIVAATLGVGEAIITESTLSFLGVGFPPDTPTWGRLVTDGYQYLSVAPHMAIIPGALIFLTVLSVNFMGDGLRDALDPRSRL